MPAAHKTRISLLCCHIFVALLLNSFGPLVLAAQEQPNAGLEMRPLNANSSDLKKHLAGLITENSINAEIAGPLVTLTIRQSFKNTSRYFTEGLYRFPLPDDASVGAMTLRVGERLIKGEVQERVQAEKTYRKAIKAGKRAALLSEHRPNIFSTRIGNIAPGETVSVELTILSAAQMDGRRLSWRLPQAITPRFMGAQTSATHKSHRSASALLFEQQFLGYPHMDEESDASGSGSSAVRAATFKANFKAQENIHNAQILSEKFFSTAYDQHITLSPLAGFVRMDQDLILSWEIAPDATAEKLHFIEYAGNSSYHMAVIPTPTITQTPAYMPRDLILILDTSGSMTGMSIDQAKQAVTEAINSLDTQDRFDIIEFNNNYRPLFGRYRRASDRHKRSAISWVKALEAGGGTMMAPALEHSLTAYTSEPERLQQVVFITDGAVGDEASLFALVHQKLGQQRLFTVGVGPAPNGWFMRKAAEFGKGRSLHILNPQEIASALRRFMNDIRQPRLMNITAHGSGDYITTQLGDSYGDHMKLLLWADDITPKQPSRITARDAAGRDIQTHFDNQYATKTRGIRQYWARRQIETLIDQMAIKRQHHSKAGPLRDKMVNISTSHQVLSPATRFIAVDHTPIRPKNAQLLQKLQKSALPRGAKAAHFRSPPGAIGHGFSLLLALLALVGWIGLSFGRRKVLVP